MIFLVSKASNCGSEAQLPSVLLFSVYKSLLSGGKAVGA